MFVDIFQLRINSMQTQETRQEGKSDVNSF
jgi:hypothetical protein